MMKTKFLKAWIIVGWLFGMIWPAVSLAEMGGGVFYSVHLSSHISLEEAQRQVVELQRGGRRAFWRMSEVPGEPEYYRVYAGKYENEARAIDSWKLLKREGVVDHFSIHLFKTPGKTIEKKASPEFIRQLKKKPTRVARSNSLAKQRFVDNGDGTVTDRLNRLMWVKNGWREEFFSALTWNDAIEKTKNLKIGSRDGWRLPTIEEWKSIMDSRNRFPALVEPNPFENVITHMPYWSQSDFAYHEGNNNCNRIRCTFEAYIVMLYSGSVLHQNKGELAFVFPVRPLDKGELAAD